MFEKIKIKIIKFTGAALYSVFYDDYMGMENNIYTFFFVFKNQYQPNKIFLYVFKWLWLKTSPPLANMQNTLKS